MREYKVKLKGIVFIVTIDEDANLLDAFLNDECITDLLNSKAYDDLQELAWEANHQEKVLKSEYYSDEQ